MTAVNTVLVVGAGLAGTGTAILLAARGVTVDLVEVDAGISALGSGITLQGNALRVLRDLGVWEAARAEGYCFDSVGLRAPDGTVLAEIPDARTGGPDLPATLGMPRPALARILIDRARDSGVKLHFGLSVTGLGEAGDVTFSDGSTGRYDLVVGADGIRSTVRRLLGIETGPRPTGMGIWRAFGPRPASITRTDLCYGGPCHIAGYCPTGENSLYAYLVEDAQDRSGLGPVERLETMRQLASAYHGPWDEIRAALDDPARIHYTWFETHVLPAPWHRGRVVLIGDAAHSCPPTLAQGGAQALEDAAVLAELLTGHDVVDERLWTAFTDRRYARAKAVVDASNQLGQWLLDREPGDVPGLMRRITELVSQPA
ncbi:2-polyprenyl-6-methoxyphenol hydroxylase-like FAD-dependent oxidoreductase [Amycolatopsis lexingtonensis]|uniref:2-polyprenyl-6-methoxyphenol hydroxylase-like FAD-dependent oxidoreductase n=1 Tax=Amycolatopsis lexingtonensis TaxID=218822 RepID=A0ABR9HY28_9PSEU|nr:FAD-dependent oxidoreductase [Amycolatopsis lexingtonensis]MBE1495803.1 2-polyprenyl-6-methoxyphenol hydroxylase-like FAD-dependent oxidoreductase [Amycolatopsis lexingtonensis]